MSIHVRLSTTLRDCVPGYEPEQGLEIEAQGLANARELAVRTGLDPAEIKVVMVNGRSRTLDEPVADGDRVAFFPPVGGG